MLTIIIIGSRLRERPRCCRHESHSQHPTDVKRNFRLRTPSHWWPLIGYPILVWCPAARTTHSWPRKGTQWQCTIPETPKGLPCAGAVTWCTEYYFGLKCANSSHWRNGACHCGRWKNGYCLS